MMRAFFASDLHGREDRYLKLLTAVRAEQPAALLLGGDLLPRGARPRKTEVDTGARPRKTEVDTSAGARDFLLDWLGPRLASLRSALGPAYPRVLVIFGNDDPRSHEPALDALAAQGLLQHIHAARAEVAGVAVFGYACVPPTPFALKDWERYDVSRFVDPDCVSPEEGYRSVPVAEGEARYATIASDLEALTGSEDVAGAVFLFHSPPHGTLLDRAALDGAAFDHAPLDPHVGSIAIRRFIEARQPRATLHGHVHESARITGSWRQRIGRTHCLSAAHDGPELALVRFDLDRPEGATRELL
jgi:Icc-related predicted phosphoesterase